MRNYLIGEKVKFEGKIYMVDVHSISTHCTRTEFVGTAVLDTIGLVISGIDETLLEKMNVGKKYRETSINC